MHFTLSRLVGIHIYHAMQHACMSSIHSILLMMMMHDDGERTNKPLYNAHVILPSVCVCVCEFTHLSLDSFWPHPQTRFDILPSFSVLSIILIIIESFPHFDYIYACAWIELNARAHFNRSL